MKRFEVKLVYTCNAVVSVFADNDDDALSKARELVEEGVDLSFDDSIVDDISMLEVLCNFVILI